MTGRFLVELPADEDGNTSMRPAVIEGRIVQGGTPEAASFTDPAREVLLITAPPEVAKHVRVYVDGYGGFAEVPGPARLLDAREYAALIKTVTR